MKRHTGCSGIGRHLAVLAVLALLVAAACGRDAARDGTPGGDAAIDPDARYQRYTAVQVAAFRNTSAAAHLRDSLAGAGWATVLRPTPDSAAWRVQVAPTRQLAHIEIVAHALRRALGDSAIRVVQDSARVATDAVTGFTRVRYGAAFVSRARWALSDDRRTLLVVEDAASVENDPSPNGFVFAAEDGMRSIQLDSVWDVAPSPDWRRVAYGRAWVMRGERADTLPPAAWEPIADSIGLSVREVRAGAFSASGMAVMFGLAQPAVVGLGDPAAGRQAPRAIFPVLAGWRMAWTGDGSAVLAGVAPPSPQDDTPAASWLRVDPTTGQAQQVAQQPDMATVPWVEGPTIDISVAPDTGQRIAIAIDDGTVESSGGWIRMNGRMVAPGVALAATRTGRYLVALVPNPSAKEYEAGWMLAVYTIDGDGNDPEPRGP